MKLPVLSRNARSADASSWQNILGGHTPRKRGEAGMSEVMDLRRTAICRGCELILSEVLEDGPGVWVDAEGNPVCIKAQFGRHPVLHMPLPEGFRGGPQ